MDASRIRDLAAGARESLRAEAEARLGAALAEGSAERLSSPSEVAALEADVASRGRGAVVESAAYTWFNRLCALRYMDARGYTPVGIVTPRPGSTRPAVLEDAAEGVFAPELGLDRLQRDRVLSLLAGTTPSADPSEAAYAELLRAACRLYAGPMPYLFAEERASALLMPAGLLSEGSILSRIVSGMDDGQCGSVEVLGWLYQYYVAERKDEVFASFKRGGKAGPEEMGPATQLFTPGWIVRYLADNSLGRLWLRGNPSSPLGGSLEYYVECEGEGGLPGADSAEDVSVLDPACGSGHILVYAFDLLCQMYEEEGWPEEEVPRMVLERNLHGLEIDRRAAEIAGFALEMKARERDPHFFDKRVSADICVLEPVSFAPGELDGAGMVAGRAPLLDAFEHMGEVGSLYVPDSTDLPLVDDAIGRLSGRRDLASGRTVAKLRRMRDMLEHLSATHDVVIANPPYMGSKNMNPWLSGWVKAHYPDEKGDLCTCFINRGFRFCRPEGYIGIITSDTCMYISSFEKMRRHLIDDATIITFVDTRGTNAHPDMFDANAGWVLSSNHVAGYRGAYFKLNHRISEKGFALVEAIQNPDCGWLYHADAASFSDIPGTPIAYWISDKVRDAYVNGHTFSDEGCPKVGMQTSNNDKYLRLWWEVRWTDFHADSKKQIWIKYLKGGEFRRWYGNLHYILHYNQNPNYILEQKNARVLDISYLEKRKCTWTDLTSGMPSFRFAPTDSFYDISGHCFFPDTEDQQYFLLAYTNTSFVSMMKKVFNSSFHFQVGDLRRIVIPQVEHNEYMNVVAMSKRCVSLSRADWDSLETSWDFSRHPMLPEGPHDGLVADAYEARKAEANARFEGLRANEEELNRTFAQIYHMEGEVPTAVEDRYVSVAKIFDSRDDVPESYRNNAYVRTRRDEAASLVSYAVGCMMGRYSLDTPGLVLADQGSTVDDYLERVPEPSFAPDRDGILPVLDGEWFEDDIVAEFRSWLAAAFGEGHLEENLAFVEDALGEDVRSYFTKHFYEDHLRAYQRRPIYWLFSSPKKGFSCLVYVHRYDEGTVGDILTGYLRPYRDKLSAAADALEATGSAGDRRDAERYRARVRELDGWERDVVYPLAHERVSIDLDDGVKANYNRFPRALRKVAGLSEWR